MAVELIQIIRIKLKVTGSTEAYLPAKGV